MGYTHCHCRRVGITVLYYFGLVTDPLPNARQSVRVSRVLGDDHYKRMPHVTVEVVL